MEDHSRDLEAMSEQCYYSIPMHHSAVDVYQQAGSQTQMYTFAGQLAPRKAEIPTL